METAEGFPEQGTGVCEATQHHRETTASEQPAEKQKQPLKQKKHRAKNSKSKLQSQHVMAHLTEE